MVLSAVPGGLFRVRSLGAPDDGAPARRLAADRCASLAAALMSVTPTRDRVLSLYRAEPPKESAAAGPTSDAGNGDASAPPVTPPPAPARPPAAPPPLPVVVVHRQPTGSAPVSPQRGGRRLAFGEDPLDEGNAPRALRRAIDQLLGDIAEKRDDHRDRDRNEDRDEHRP